MTYISDHLILMRFANLTPKSNDLSTSSYGPSDVSLQCSIPVQVHVIRKDRIVYRQSDS